MIKITFLSNASSRHFAFEWNCTLIGFNWLFRNAYKIDSTLCSTWKCVKFYFDWFRWRVNFLLWFFNFLLVWKPFYAVYVFRALIICFIKKVVVVTVVNFRILLIFLTLNLLVLSFKFFAWFLIKRFLSFQVNLFKVALKILIAQKYFIDKFITRWENFLPNLIFFIKIFWLIRLIHQNILRIIILRHKFLPSNILNLLYPKGRIRRFDSNTFK